MLLMAGPSTYSDPLPKVPVAVKDCFWPTAIVLAAGVTAMVSQLGDAATAAVVTRVAHSTTVNLAGKARVGRLR